MRTRREISVPISYTFFIKTPYYWHMYRDYKEVVVTATSCSTPLKISPKSSGELPPALSPRHPRCSWVFRVSRFRAYKDYD